MSMPRLSQLLSLRTALALVAGLAVASAAWARQAPGAPGAPTPGSPNTVTAAPPVPRPATTPCTVPLFTNFMFADFNPKTFSYTPPAACPGPWAAVVLEVDLSIDAGVQFDRTAQIALGHVNIYYGTTAEPSSSFGPSWHVERDLTDYSALFTSPQTGDVNLGNLVTSQFTSVLTGSATLQFYPTSAAAPASRTADVVLPMSDAPGGAVLLATTTDALAPSFNLPTNIERAVLDVFAQSQHNDEFWYTCVPDGVANELESCGGTAFRETEITIDGKAAGVAPVRPWIFTGGLDPDLWAPLPGVQTLNFAPFRVDLTPFASVLSDGHPHQVGISVFNSNNYFLVSGTLLLFLDAGSAQVTGAVTGNTLGAAPNPFFKTELKKSADGTIHAVVTTTSRRAYTISGFVNTSHGRVQTTLNDVVNFSSTEQFVIGSAEFVQNITQDTLASTQTTTRAGGAPVVAFRAFDYPLTVDISVPFNSDGSGQQTVVIQQTFENNGSLTGNGSQTFDGTFDSVSSRDTLLFNAKGQVTGDQGRKSSARFFSESTDGMCFSRALASAKGVLDTVRDGKGCPGGMNTF
jgi:hypothetical protein